MTNKTISLLESQTPICPSCGTYMIGFGASFYFLQCPSCDCRLEGVKVQATLSFEEVITGICLLLIIGTIAEIFS